MSYRLRVDRLRAAARAKGDRNGHQIALRTGLSESTVSRLLRGTTQPGLKTLMVLGRSYGQTVSDLIEELAA